MREEEELPVTWRIERATVDRVYAGFRTDVRLRAPGSVLLHDMGTHVRFDIENALRPIWLFERSALQDPWRPT